MGYESCLAFLYPFPGEAEAEEHIHAQREREREEREEKKEKNKRECKGVVMCVSVRLTHSCAISLSLCVYQSKREDVKELPPAKEVERRKKNTHTHTEQRKKKLSLDADVVEVTSVSVVGCGGVWVCNGQRDEMR